VFLTSVLGEDEIGLTPRPLYSRKGNSDTNFIGGWVGPSQSQCGSGGEEKISLPLSGIEPQDNTIKFHLSSHMELGVGNPTLRVKVDL
jgi:hypothetical protein